MFVGNRYRKRKCDGGEEEQVKMKREQVDIYYFDPPSKDNSPQCTMRGNLSFEVEVAIARMRIVCVPTKYSLDLLNNYFEFLP